MITKVCRRRSNMAIRLDKDSGEFRANVVFGIGDGNTNVTGVIDYYHRNSIFNRDRGYSAVPPFLSSNSTPENLSVDLRSGCRGWRNASSGLRPCGQHTRSPEHLLRPRAVRLEWNRPASAYTYTRGSRGRLSTSTCSRPLTHSIENYGGFVDFDHKWFGDQVVIYGDLYYQNAQSHDELAPSATGDFQTAGQVTIGHPATHKSERRGASGGPDL